MLPFFLLMGLLGIVIWVIAIHKMMQRGDDEFPGQYDKIAWSIVLAFSGPIGACVYLFLFEFFNNSTALPVAGAAPAKKQEGLKCLQCGTLIPDNQNECPQCGWSYAEGTRGRFYD